MAKEATPSEPFAFPGTAPLRCSKERATRNHFPESRRGAPLLIWKCLPFLIEALYLRATSLNIVR